MTKTWKQLDHEIEDQELTDFAGGKFKYNALQRARLGFAVQGILQDRGIEARDLDDDALAALARAELARGQAPTPAAPPKKTVLGRGAITEDQARTLPRFDFIAHWLTIVTKKKENRGPLGLWVKRVGKRWQIMSPVGGGTITFETDDPALLFDYARRGQLGSHIRDAEEFRARAYQRAGLG
jgi:hypothetical protein